jgi:hypothetical protein
MDEFFDRDVRQGSMRRGLSTIRETPAEQRFDEGGEAPNLTKGITSSLTNLMELIGPQADAYWMTQDALQSGRDFSKGDIPEGLSNLGMALASIPMMFIPGTTQSIRKGAKEVKRGLTTFANPLEVGVDESLISGKALKKYTQEDFNILDNLINQGRATAGTSTANKKINTPIETGTMVGVRLNLNSKIKDVPKHLKPMLQTIHKNSASGTALSYKPYATVVATDKKKVKFYVNPKARESIAGGDPKYNAMSVDGAYDPNLKILPSDPDVIEIGFNPYKHHLFIDLNTGQAVKEADAATVIGDRVYAKGVTYFKKSEAPKPKASSQVRYKEKRGGGSVMERNPYGYSPRAI